MTKSVTVRGVAYPSQRAAADALGVSPQSVSSANRRGMLDTVGLGPPQKGCDAVYSKPITVNGVEWASHKALAEHLGVSQSQLSAYFTVHAAIMHDNKGE